MEIKKAAVAGTMESSDVYVEIKPASDIAVQIESVVAQQFGEEIERVVRQVLEENRIPDEQVEFAIASGMITSEVGLIEIPHLVAPVGLHQLSEGIQEVNDRNLEAAKRVDEIGQMLAAQTESLREMQKQADDFNHRENVKVYRNVQAVVVEEVKNQTQELKAAEKGTRILLIFTLAASLANVALFILQILGILGI